jgi:hypothetical protein
MLDTAQPSCKPDPQQTAQKHHTKRRTCEPQQVLAVQRLHLLTT